MRLGVGQQQLVDLLGADLLGGGRCAHVDAWGFIAATAQKGDALDVDAAGKGADHALLDLSAINALEREQVAADVVEHLDGVAVQCIDLVAQLEQRHHGVGIDLAGAVLQRVDLGRV